MYLYTLIPLLSILGFSIFLNRKMKFELKIALPVFTSLLIMILYISATIGILFYSTIFVYIVGIILLLYHYKNDIEAFDFIKNNKSKIAGISLVIFFIGLYFNDGYLSEIGDLSFLGIATKELLIRHRFEIPGDQTSIIQIYSNYPRGSSIFHYFIMLPNGFSEGGALFSHFIIHLCYLIPLFIRDKFRISVFAILFAISLSSLLSLSFIESLYNYSLITFIFSSAFIISLGRGYSNHHTWYLVALMPLIDQAGLFLAVIMSLILCYKFMQHKKLPIYSFRKLHIIFIGLIISPLMVYLINKIYHATNIDFDLQNPKSSLKFHNILTIFYDIFITIWEFKLALVIVYLVAYITYRYAKQDSEIKNNFLNNIKELILGFAIFLIWTICYSIYNGSSETTISVLKDFEIPCLAIPVVIISLYYLIQVFPSKELKRNEKLGIIIAAIFSFIVFVDTLDRIPTFLSLEETVYHNQIREVRDYIKSGKQIEISYEGKPGRQECHELAFRMSPYFNSYHMDKCISAPNEARNVYLGTIRKLPENNSDKCKLIFKPFLRDYELKCIEG